MWLQDIKKSEYILGAIKTTAVFLLILYVFYGTFAAAPFLIPVWFLYMRDWIRDTAGEKEEALGGQVRGRDDGKAGGVEGGARCAKA